MYIRGLRLALKIKSPLLTAFALAMLAKPSSRDGTIQLLALHKDQFDEDIALLQDANPKFILRSLNLYYLKLIFRMISSEPLEGLTGYNYYSTANWKLAKNEYHQFLCKMLPIFCKLTGIQGVITCNHTYVAQQEFSRTCLMLDIPFINVLKEGMIVPERTNDWHKYYKDHYYNGPVHANLICTPNAYVANWVSNSPA